MGGHKSVVKSVTASRKKLQFMDALLWNRTVAIEVGACSVSRVSLNFERVGGGDSSAAHKLNPPC
jgi:hypothetical protein